MPNDILDPESVVQKGADGPKYNEDFNLLDDSSESKKVPAKISDAESESELEEDEEITEEDEEVIASTKEDEEDAKKPNIIYDRPSFGEIKAKFPEITKEFPQLRDMFYRESEFTKLFPTVDDAREAFEDNEAFINLRDSVISGDSTPLIEAVKSQSNQAVAAFGVDFLSKLAKNDNESYVAVITPLFENLVRNFHNSDDENQKNAALLLSQWLFKDTGVAEGKKTFQKEIKLEKRDESKDVETFNQKAGEVGAKANQALGALVLKNLDPGNALTPSIKKLVLNDIINQIQNQLGSDKEHMTVMNSRWKRAKSNGYTDDDQAKIISTFLARAKSLIPSISTKVMNDALGTQKKASKDKEERISAVAPVRRESNGGHSGAAAPKSNGKMDYRKMSDLDILNS